MSDLKAKLYHYAGDARRYAALARLTPLQWPLLILTPTLGALLMATNGEPPVGTLAGVVILALALWGIALCTHDLRAVRRGYAIESLILRGMATRREAVYLLVTLGLLALLTTLLLDRHVAMVVPLFVLVALSYPWLRKRSYLIDVWFGVGVAWCVLLAFGAAGQWPDKSGALLGVVTLLWATGWSVLYNWPKQAELLQRGFRTLGHMFGLLTGYIVIGLQAMVLMGAWMAGTQAKLGSVYQAALLIAVAAVVWQLLLIHRKRLAAIDRSLQLHLLSGMALWAGVALHFLTAS